MDPVPLDVLTIDAARELAEVLETAHARVLTLIADQVADGDLDAPEWLRRKEAELPLLVNRVRALVVKMERDAGVKINTLTLAAYAAGTAVAESTLPAGLLYAATAGPVAATTQMQNELRRAVRASRNGIETGAQRAYRTILTETVATTTGTVTRRQAAQAALDKLARAGVGSVTDGSGRRWRPDTYVEMVSRTVLADAHQRGTHARYQSAGYDLVIVSDSPQECDACRPWEGKVLSITGNTADYPTLAQARSKGFQHPCCTHSTRLFIEGVTKRREPQADPAGYKARQQLRYHERQVREAKERLAVATTPGAKAKAKRLLADRSERLTTHVDATGAKRQRHRERLDAR